MLDQLIKQTNSSMKSGYSEAKHESITFSKPIEELQPAMKLEVDISNVDALNVLQKSSSNTVSAL